MLSTGSTERQIIDGYFVLFLGKNFIGNLSSISKRSDQLLWPIGLPTLVTDGLTDGLECLSACLVVLMWHVY